MRYRLFPILLTASIVIFTGCRTSADADSFDSFEKEMSMDDDLKVADTDIDTTSQFFTDTEKTMQFFDDAQADLEMDPCKVTPTALKSLVSEALCNKCEFTLLPGAATPSPVTRYTIHSDLPEIFLTPGVLYGTVPVLPPFKTKDGTDVPELTRTQHNKGFKTIDGDFEVFIFQISQPGSGAQPRRVVVYAENMGKTAVTVDPRQVIVTDGIIAAVHEMESNLGRRVLANDWDRPKKGLSIPAGEGRVVAYSKQFAAPRNGPDSSANVNCFGIVRADVEPYLDEKPNLRVWILGIPGEDNLGTLDTLARENLAVGAQSGEGYIDLLREPQGCALSRTCGVFPSFVWRSELMTLDAATLSTDGVQFQMAVPAIQSQGCPEVRQTVDLLLHQKYNRPDTVGNYMVEYRVAFRLVNKNAAPRKVDLRFGKKDADIGLAWQVVLDDLIPADDARVDAAPVRTGWAGPKQTADLGDDTRSFLEADGGMITLPPCGQKYVTIRFMILGNSSLPMQLKVAGEPGI